MIGLKYKFGSSYDSPYIDIDHGQGPTADPYGLNTDLNQLTGNQIRHTVEELEKVKKGKKKFVTFDTS